MNINVQANCDWGISETPNWCIVQKTVSDGKECLKIEIRPNDSEKPREAIVTLMGNKVTTSLSIIQKGYNIPKDVLVWHTFTPNEFSDIQYNLLSDNVTRVYRISGKQHFVNPKIKDRIFLGNLINQYSVNSYIKDYYDQYTFSPITITATSIHSGQTLSRRLPQPSYEHLKAFVADIITGDLSQGTSFQYSDNPIPFYSYRHLYLLGMGNYGLALNEFISGQSYMEQEMQKRTGLIYNYCFELFKIVMDYPEQLIKESIDNTLLPSLAYINSMAYGRTALLLIETDDDYTQTTEVIRKKMKGWELKPQEIQLLNRIVACYIHFNTQGDIIVEKGDEKLIEQYIADIKNIDICPLYFTINKLSNHQIGTFTREITIP